MSVSPANHASSTPIDAQNNQDFRLLVAGENNTQQSVPTLPQLNKRNFLGTNNETTLKKLEEYITAKAHIIGYTPPETIIINNSFFDRESLEILIKLSKIMPANRKFIFNQCNFAGTNLSKLDLGEHFSFFNSNLQDVNLSGANLKFTELKFSNLQNADLSNAISQNTDFSNASMKGAKLNGADITNAIFDNAKEVNKHGAIINNK